ncbi:hypothetical protein BaRGS_00002010, partial [Batillaria attramentaria]
MSGLSDIRSAGMPQFMFPDRDGTFAVPELEVKAERQIQNEISGLKQQRDVFGTALNHELPASCTHWLYHCRTVLQKIFEDGRR